MIDKESVQKEAPDVYLDFEGTISILRKRGVEVNLESTARELGYTTAGLIKLRKKAPKIVSVIRDYLRDNCLEFDDLVKEVKSKK